MRILGIDFGKKRVGLALSDPMFMTAQPHGYVPNDPKLFGRLREIVETQEVGEIVVGHPISMSGRVSEMTTEAEAFAQKLRNAVPAVNVSLWDERLTTMEAEKFLVSADVRRSKRKEVRDAVAASLMLQGYLAARKKD